MKHGSFANAAMACSDLASPVLLLNGMNLGFPAALGDYSGYMMYGVRHTSVRRP